MELSPRLYDCFIRPKWLSKIFIDQVITQNFDINNKVILDFGSGTGANCCMFDPSRYLGVDIDIKRVKYARYQYPGYNFDVLRDKCLPASEDSTDYILSIAVLHHIPSQDILDYLSQFRKILKSDGKILVIEPCYFKDSYLNNRFMNLLDRGKFIRYEDEYLNLFESAGYRGTVIKRFKKVLYNEIFFSASPA